MSCVDLGPLNCGTPRPYAIDPEYAEAYVCDVHDDIHGPEVVDRVEGASNLADLKRRGHKFGPKVTDVCCACYDRIRDTPICSRCGIDQEETKRGVWLCMDCPEEDMEQRT